MAGVSKVFIEVNGGEETYFLFSRKNKKRESQATGRLELLGGNSDENESPLDTLIRELEEEDLSLTLSRKIPQEPPREINVDGEPHYMYHLVITWDELSKLRHDSVESFGFELVPIEMMRQDFFEEDITKKTKKILREYNPAL